MPKEHAVHVKNPYEEYCYNTEHWVKVIKRTIYIDFEWVTESRDRALKAAALNFALVPVLTEDTPFTNALRSRVRRFQTPAEMITQINDYFKSCWGYLYTKAGALIYDDNGKPVRVQKQPYTVMGICLALGLDHYNIKYYQECAKAGRIDMGFWNVLATALNIVQEYAEKGLYDRDASAGAKFMLQSSFGWVTPKEEAEIKHLKKKTKLLSEEFALKQRMLEGVDDAGNELEIRIVRKAD